MISYRFRRRSLLAGVGGALGLELLLQNLEASAEGAKPPPRLLVLHWPRGIVRRHFVPIETGANYVAPRLLMPFEALRSDLLAFYGFSHRGIGDGGGTPHDAGLVRTMTGANAPGLRTGAASGEVCAGGPSWDQIFLKNVPALSRRNGDEIVGRGYANALGDTRVDSATPGGRCISYGYQKTNAVSPSGAIIAQNQLLRPVGSPLTLYNDLFSNYVPGGGAVPPGALKALSMKKSVLDSALRELARVRELAPSSERPKLDAHEETIRQMEVSIVARMNGMGPGAMACTVPTVPPAPPVRGSGGEPLTREQYAQVTLAHADVIRAAFACDLVRVATLQFAPAFHEPAADALGPDFFAREPPAETSADHATYESASELAEFYLGIAAQIVARFKEQPDGLDPLGEKLLARTLVPVVTEVSDCGHALDRLPALVFGGRALGMQGGRFESFESNPRSMNDFWVTIAQPLLGTRDPLASLVGETFVKDGVAPVPGLWTAPA